MKPRTLFVISALLAIPRAAFACPTCWQDQSTGALVAVGVMAFLPMVVGFSVWWVLSRQLGDRPKPQ